MGLVGSISDIRGKGHRPAKVMASGGTPTPPATFDTIWYGQSNLLGHIGQSNSPPAAAEGTQVWDPATSAWITPVGNGIREFLNAMTAATGLPSRVVYGGQSGVAIADLQKGAGTGYYETMMARVVASGITPKRIIIHHGEGDANTASPNAVAYRTALDTLHGSIVGDLGLTKATCPMIVSGLGNAPTWATNAKWATIQGAIALVNATYPNIHYSHSNFDATLADDVHWDGATYGRSGARYARTAQVLMGSVSTRPKWFITGAARVSTTETDITVVHDMGSDFTPTTSITGFEASGDNGASYVSATGARIDATTIRLTHADLGTTARNVRYQYGRDAPGAGPVLDNSALANPLNFTPEDVVAAGAALLPAITYSSSLSSSSSGQTQTHAGSFSVPGGSEALLAIIGNTIAGGAYTSLSVTAQPSGDVIAATLVEKHDSTGSVPPAGAIYQAELPSGTTSITVSVTYTSNPFSNSRFHVATIPVASLSSTTKVGSGKLRTASSLTSTTTLATTSGGVVFAIGVDGLTTGGNSGAFTGTETYATRNSAIAFGATHAVADTSNVGANASSSVTVTFNQSANTTVIAGSWR